MVGLRSVNSYAFFSDRGDTIGQMFLELFEGNERRLTGDEITEQIRQYTNDLAGISIELLPQEMVFGTQNGCFWNDFLLSKLESVGILFWKI